MLYSYLYVMNQMYIFNGPLAWGLSFVQNMFGNVISFSNIGQTIVLMLSKGQYSAVFYEYGLLVRLIVFAIQPIQYETLSKTHSSSNHTSYVSANYLYLTYHLGNFNQFRVLSEVGGLGQVEQ